MKLNEPGRQQLGRSKKPCKQAQHAIYDIILTYFRLRRREPMIDLGSHQGDP